MPELRRSSVRFRVTGLATMIVAALLVVVAVALVLVQHRMLTATVDEGLRQRADDLAIVVAEAITPSLAGVDDDSAAQLVDRDGNVLAVSPNLEGSGVIAPVPAEAEVVAERHLKLPDDSFRVLSRIVDSPDGELVLHVATAADDVSDSVAILRTSLLTTIPLAIVSLAVMVWWLVGKALEPVEAIRREVAEIGDSDLDRRVPVPETEDEIGRLAATMNSMLDRIEGGVAQLRRFVADASHELRSPLTRMRSELEVDLANRDSADLIATHQSVLEEAVALQRLVDDLLYLARSDAGSLRSPTDTVDLDDIVLAEADQLRAASTLSVDVAGVSAGQVVGERSQLARAVRNLGENGAKHARSCVAFTLRESDAEVVLTVVDDGPGVIPEERERIFERFARTDEGRSRDDGGSGLGLAIVRDIVTRHRGTIAVDAHYDRGARFVIRLPRSG